MRRAIAMGAVVVGLAAPVAPALANHADPNCTLTVHHPLGTDDVTIPEPVPLPVDDPPTDIGLVKVFVNCQHGGGQGHGHGGGRG